jgi:hypothetical protein
VSHRAALAAGDLMAIAEEAGAARLGENVVQCTREDLARIVAAGREAALEPVAWMTTSGHFVAADRTARNADALHGWRPLFDRHHSPGPWSFKPCESDPSLFQLLDASGRVIGFIRRGNGSRAEAREFEANARVAAASVTVMELAARVCEEQAKRFTDDRGSYVARECAAAIRANIGA